MAFHSVNPSVLVKISATLMLGTNGNTDSPIYHKKFWHADCQKIYKRMPMRQTFVFCVSCRDEIPQYDEQISKLMSYESYNRILNLRHNPLIVNHNGNIILQPIPMYEKIIECAETSDEINLSKNAFIGYDGVIIYRWVHHGEYQFSTSKRVNARFSRFGSKEARFISEEMWALGGPSNAELFNLEMSDCEGNGVMHAFYVATKHMSPLNAAELGDGRIFYIGAFNRYPIFALDPSNPRISCKLTPGRIRPFSTLPPRQETLEDAIAGLNTENPEDAVAIELEKLNRKMYYLDDYLDKIYDENLSLFAPIQIPKTIRESLPDIGNPNDSVEFATTYSIEPNSNHVITFPILNTPDQMNDHIAKRHGSIFVTGITMDVDFCLYKLISIDTACSRALVPTGVTFDSRYREFVNVARSYISGNTDDSQKYTFIAYALITFSQLASGLKEFSKDEIQNIVSKKYGGDPAEDKLCEDFLLAETLRKLV